MQCFSYMFPPSGQSSWRLRIQRESESFRAIYGLRSKKSAEAIENDGSHVLVNCNGYEKEERAELLELRVAPIQASFMAYPGRLGAHYMAYFITSIVTSPRR